MSPNIPLNAMTNLLVLGGSGFVGRSLCEQLVTRSGGADGRITVPSRHPQRAAHLRSLPTLDVVDANLHDDAQLAQLVAGRDAVVNLVAVLHGSEAEFEKAHVTLPRRLAAACKTAGVRRVMHVSALGVSDDDARTAPSNYLRSKTQGERVLRDAGLDLTLLRPSVIFGEHDRFINLFASLQAVFPLMPLAGADARFQPVWVDDVARAIVACLERPETMGQTYECVGPAQFSLADLVRLAGRWSGHARPVLPLPAFAGRLQAMVMECLPGEPLMSRDNLDSMRAPNVATPGVPGLAALGIDAAAIESVMPAVLGHRAGVARLDPLRRGAGRA